MKNTTVLVLIILCSAFLFLCFSGCIEGSFTKTETVLAKLDRAGNPEWISVFENSGYANARSLAPGTVQGIQTSDGFFLAGFFTNTTGAGYLRVLKTDSSGNLIHETMLPAIQGQVLLITRRDDGGYLIVSRPGQMYTFSGQGDLEKAVDISEQVNQLSASEPASQKNSPITLLSISRSGTGDLAAIVRNHADIYHPVQMILLSANGTVRKIPIPESAGIDQALSVWPTQDGELILEKSVYGNQPGGGKQILLERIDANGTIIWNTTLGACNYTFCTNDLVGLSERGFREFEILYQSHEQSNASSSSPVMIIHTRLDDTGHVTEQKIISDVSGLPSWIFRTGSSSDFRDLINERALTVMSSDKSNGKSGILSVSILGTDDGGYALIATRYQE
jgi:hypothetical protein